jgi:hypothetical protein
MLLQSGMVVHPGQCAIKERSYQMLTITDEAKNELQNILEQNPGKSLRVVMAGFG